MFDDDNYRNNEEENNDEIPTYFYSWDEAINNGTSPGYYEAEDLCDIIDIYFNKGDFTKGRYTIDYAFKLYPENDELVYEILLLLNDYELWNDLLTLSLKYADMSEIWADGHRLTALLHLGMEEDAFQFFKKLKNKYSDDKESLSIIYQAMGEALYEVDLYDASIEVLQEAISIVGPDINLLWLQLQSYLSIDDKESVIELCEQIQKLNPMDAETWHRLGNTYKEIKEIGKSIEAYEFAQSLGFKDSSNLMNMIHAYEKNENYGKALEKAEEYLIMYPDSYLVNLIAANLSSQIENWEMAVKYINNTIKLEPETEFLYLYKSNFLLKLEEPKKAIMALEEGLSKTKDTSGDLKKQLGILHERYPEY